MKAIWKGNIIAHSNETIKIEGNHYFPHESVNKQYLRESNTNTVCHWKGTASYYDIAFDENIIKDAAWYYPAPSQLAKKINNYVAFGKGADIIDD